MDNKPTTIENKLDVPEGPKGVGFTNIKSGETHYLRLESQIQAYINSSNLGINASRGQDFGWRLAKEWVQAVKAYRRNEAKMELLSSRNGGQKVTDVQILHAIYGEQVRAAQERADEDEAPYEEEYLRSISGDAKVVAEEGPANEDEPTEPVKPNSPPKASSSKK